MTFETRPILVPVDFSEPSGRALMWAADLAALIGASLVVVHVIHELAPGSYVRTEAGTLENYEQAATSMMDEFIGRISEERPNVAAAERVLVPGIPVTRILEVAAKKDAQHIVMGSHGRTGLSRLLLGSKAERVVQLSPIPVTIIKPETDSEFKH